MYTLNPSRPDIPIYTPHPHHSNHLQTPLQASSPQRPPPKPETRHRSHSPSSSPVKSIAAPLVATIATNDIRIEFALHPKTRLIRAEERVEFRSAHRVPGSIVEL